jgi:hypothetical protein
MNARFALIFQSNVGGSFALVDYARRGGASQNRPAMTR